MAISNELIAQFLKGDFLSLSTLKSNPNEILLSIYSNYRLGKYQIAKSELLELQESSITGSFGSQLLILLEILILEIEVDNLAEIITEKSLRPLMEEIKIIDHFKKGHFDEIIENYQDIEKIVSSSNNHIYVYLLILISKVYLRSRDFTTTKRLYDCGIEFSKKIDNEFLEIDILIELSEYYRRKGEFSKVDHSLSLVKKKSDKLSYIEGIQRYEQIIAINHFRRGEYSLAKSSFKSSLDLRVRYSKDRLIGHTAMLLGMCYMNTTDFQEAEKYLTQALRIHERNDNIDGIMTINGLMASIFEEKGDLSKSKELLLQVLGYWQERSNQVYIAETFLHLSSVTVKQGKYSQAFQYLKQAHQVAESGGPQLLGRIHTYIGDLHRLRGEFSMAMENYQQGKEYFEQVENSHEVAMLSKQMGLLSYYMNNIDQMKHYFNQSLVLLEEIEDDVTFAELLFWNIKLLSEEKEENKKSEYFKSLELIYSKSDNVFVQLYYHMARIYQNIQSQELIELAEAKKIILDLIDMEIPDKEIALNVNLSYLELLLFEYLKLNKEAIYDDILTISTKLMEFTQKEQLYSYYAELSLILGKLYQSSKRFDDAHELLKSSLELVMSKSIFSLALPLAQALDELTNMNYLSSQGQKLLEINSDIGFSVSYRKFEDKAKEGKDIGKSLIVLDVDWDILYAVDFATEGVTSTEFQVLTEIIREKFPVEKTNENLHYLSLDQYEVVFIDDQIKIIHAYTTSSYIAGEKIKLLHKRITTSKAISSLIQQDKKQADAYLRRELEEIVNQIFSWDGDDPSEYSSDFSLKEIDDLKRYNEFLHPIRLSIMILLDANYQLPRSIIQELVNVNPGTLKNHLDRLMSHDFIGKSLLFIDEKPRDVYFLEPHGSVQFVKFKELFEKYQ